MVRPKISSAFGALFVLTGIIVPSSSIINLLRAEYIEFSGKLILGATLFKIGLVILGVLVIVMGRMFMWNKEIQEKKPDHDPYKVSAIAILAGILFAATALRLYGLGYGLWYDEILTYVNYASKPLGKIVTTYDDQNNHILFTILSHLSFRVFGESAWSLRLPAVFFGVGSIVALYLFACQVGSKREALLSAALLTFSYHHIWFSQNARGYTGLLFWTILSSYLLVRGLRESLPRIWILYAIAVALGVYTHMTMSFVLIGHFIIYLIMLFTWRKEFSSGRLTGFFLGFCLAGFLTFQLYALVFPQIVGGTLWLGANKTITEWKNPVWTLLEFVKGMKIGFTVSVLAIAALFVFCFGLFKFIRKDPLVFLLLAIPPLVGITVMISMGHPLFPRSFFFATGFGILVIIRGTMQLGHLATLLSRHKSLRSITVGTVFCICLIIISMVSIPSAYGPKQDYLGALTFVEEKKKPGDAIVTVGYPTTFPYMQFYKMDWEAVETLTALNAIRSRVKRTWLLYTMPPYLKSVYPEIMNSIQRDFKVVKQFSGSLNGGTIFVSQSRSPSF